MPRSFTTIGRLVMHPIVSVVFALIWLGLRSGRKPSRLSYPCQQAALGTTTMILGLPLAHGLIRLARHVPIRRGHALAIGVAAAAVAFVMIADPVERSSAASGPGLSPPGDYVADVYVVENVPMPRVDRHPGVDDLVACMSQDGLHLYRSTTGAPGTSPDGIVGAEDVVLIKVNQQWSERGGTNTDVLRGIIRCVVEHPDGFGGEVVVVENTQSRGTLAWAYSNAEQTSQSVMTVVDDFADEGWSVGAYLWDDLRGTSVDEYEAGSMEDGYVIDAVRDPESNILVSYPKFRTPGGRYVSLRHGIWDEAGATYDDTTLTFINVPVLKCHAIYGVTASVKNHMGSMTTTFSTNAHAGVALGGCGSFLADVRMPDLNVLDCIYILAHPGSGPACGYSQATRVDHLLAAVDPVALDMWAVTNVLVPAILANGHTSYPDQDPANSSGDFRRYLDASMNELLRAGIDVTNDLDAITAHIHDSTAVDPPAPTGTVTSPVRTYASPNPFRASTSLRVEGGAPADLRVEILDVTGRKIRTLTPRPQGEASAASWNGRDTAGRRVAPGVYGYRFVDRRERALVTGRVTVLR